MTDFSLDPVRLSLSEIDALGRKAARGSGCPWGLAEEAGKAARWISGYGLPGLEALAQLLTSERRCGCTQAVGAPECAISCGAQLSDEAADVAAGHPIDFGNVAEPLLVLAQASRSANALGVTLALSWQDFSATCFPDGLAIEQGTGTWDRVGCGLVCRADDKTISAATATLAETGSRLVNPEAYAVLTQLANKTYAPASEHSRISGAGADTPDNN